MSIAQTPHERIQDELKNLIAKATLIAMKRNGAEKAEERADYEAQLRDLGPKIQEKRQALRELGVEVPL